MNAAQNPGRWCRVCQAHGWHHTEGHDEFDALQPQNATETDADARTVFRDRGEIIGTLTARIAELEAEVWRLGNEVAHRWTSAAVSHLIRERDSARDEMGRLSDLLIGRADAAEAVLAKLSALADEWEDVCARGANGRHGYHNGEYGDNYAADLRAALASSGRPATSDGEDAT